MDLSEMNADEAREAVASAATHAELNALEAQERDGKDRKGVLEAIAERRGSVGEDLEGSPLAVVGSSSGSETVDAKTFQIPESYDSIRGSHAGREVTIEPGSARYTTDDLAEQKVLESMGFAPEDKE